MKTILQSIFATFLLFTLTTQAQQRAALHSNGVTTIFGDINPFLDAYNASIDGDTIYLSGGGFVAPSIIDKQLTIFGAGFHPDSTTASYPTFITTNIVYLGENADSLHLEGLQFSSLYKSRNVQVNSLTIKRCKTTSDIKFSYDGTPSAFSTNLGVMECVMYSLDLNGINNSVVSNSIIDYTLSNSNSNAIRNNIFLYNGYSGGCNNNTYANNIFLSGSSTILYSSTGNIFENNIFAIAIPNLGTGSIDNNNYKGVTISTVFVNQSGNLFNYAHDYHLQTAAASAYLGTDGVEVGIYGGYFPFKEGAVPQNPHIQTKNISPQTDNNGDLNIQIQVGAQDN